MRSERHHAGLKCLFHPPHRGTDYTIAVMELPSTRRRSLPLLSLALLEVVTSPLLLATTTYESCMHEDSVATGEAGSQKQIGIRWPDQETQGGRRRWRRQRFRSWRRSRRTQGLFSFSVGRGDGEQGPPVPRRRTLQQLLPSAQSPPPPHLAAVPTVCLLSGAYRLGFKEVCCS